MDAHELGIALVHEHLLIDLQCLFAKPSNPAREHLVEQPVTAALRDTLASDPYQSKDNLILADPLLAAGELNDFHELGGRTIIDLTTRTIGPFPKQLEQIAQSTGLHIIASTGFYVDRAHPRWIADAAIEDIEAFMTNEIECGIDDTGIRPGIIGEIGTSSPITPNELKVLKASARCQKKSNLAINVHLAIFGREGHTVLDLLEAEGVAPPESRLEPSR